MYNFIYMCVCDIKKTNLTSPQQILFPERASGSPTEDRRGLSEFPGTESDTRQSCFAARWTSAPWFYWWLFRVRQWCCWVAGIFSSVPAPPHPPMEKSTFFCFRRGARAHPSSVRCSVSIHQSSILWSPDGTCGANSPKSIFGCSESPWGTYFGVYSSVTFQEWSPSSQKIIIYLMCSCGATAERCALPQPVLSHHVGTWAISLSALKNASLRVCLGPRMHVTPTVTWC